MTLTFAAALAAAAFTAAPASAAEEPPRCDPGPCIGDAIEQKVQATVAEVLWVARCVGDSLGGNACHS